jgi:hypothetical protein
MKKIISKNDVSKKEDAKTVNDVTLRLNSVTLLYRIQPTFVVL